MAPVVEPFPEALDRSLLYVFVFGADVGEAIAVALPGRGWMNRAAKRLFAGRQAITVVET